MATCLIPTSSTEHLAKNILKKNRNFQVIFPDLSKDKKRYFPDGEIYVKLPKKLLFSKKRVIVLHSGVPKPNEGLVELELILQILRDNKIKPEIFFTYFPYGMQDKVFEQGETNVAENLIGKLVNYYKVKRIYIIDPHFEGRKWIKKYPIKSISAVPLLIEKAKKDFAAEASLAPKGRGEDILFLSPDIGGKRRTGFLGIKKERIDSFRVKIASVPISFKGKIIGVIDDMIKTGGTLLKFFEVAKKAGAKKVIALVTHGVLSSGVSKIKKKYTKLYLTNTIKQKGSNIDITDLILRTISSH